MLDDFSQHNTQQEYPDWVLKHSDYTDFVHNNYIGKLTAGLHLAHRAFTYPPIKIGRGENNDITPVDKHISRNHFTIYGCDPSSNNRGRIMINCIDTSTHGVGIVTPKNAGSSILKYQNLPKQESIRFELKFGNSALIMLPNESFIGIHGKLTNEDTKIMLAPVPAVHIFKLAEISRDASPEDFQLKLKKLIGDCYEIASLIDKANCNN